MKTLFFKNALCIGGILEGCAGFVFHDASIGLGGLKSIFIDPELFLSCRRDEQVRGIGLIHQAVGRPNPVVSSFKRHDEVGFLEMAISCQNPCEVACLREKEEGREGSQTHKESLDGLW